MIFTLKEKVPTSGSDVNQLVLLMMMMITMTMNKTRQKTMFLMQLQKEVKANDIIELPTDKAYIW